MGNENYEAYLKLGYVPVEEGAVSNTLEFAYDDWCTAQFAKALGHEEDHRRFMQRLANWRKEYDPLIGFVRQRHADGRWPRSSSLKRTTTRRRTCASKTPRLTKSPSTVRGSQHANCSTAANSCWRWGLVQTPLGEPAQAWHRHQCRSQAGTWA